MQSGTNDLQEIRDLKDSKDELIEKAGDRLSSFLIKMNSNGVSNAILFKMILIRHYLGKESEYL